MIPIIIVITIILWYFLAALLLGTKWADKRFSKATTERIDTIMTRIGGYYAIPAAVFAIISPIFIEYTVPEGLGLNSMYTIDKAGKIDEHRWLALEWKYDRIINMPHKIGPVVSSVSPITDNPKVRKVIHLGEVYIKDTRFFGIASFGADTLDIEIRGFGEKIVSQKNADKVFGQFGEYWLEEFNDKHSRELASFYNPESVRQVEDYRELIEPWMNEQLDVYGLGYRVTGFDTQP